MVSNQSRDRLSQSFSGVVGEAGIDTYFNNFVPYFEKFNVPPHKRSAKTLAKLAYSYVHHREIKKIVGKIIYNFILI